MSFPFATPPWMPCPECGASVAVLERERHVCEPERKLDYEMFQLRDEVERLAAGIADFLASPRGRFAQWYAERERRQRPDAPATG